MVERIIAAGRAVLLERGYDATTTNHIAVQAGISPGSLYQYFPDKAAILTQVIERYTEDLDARVSRAFATTLGSQPTVAVRTAVTAMLDAFEEDPALLGVLVEQVPRSGDSVRATFARRMDDMMTTAIRAHQRGSSARPVDAMAWILARTVEHVTISYILERPPIARTAIIDELTELIIGYLTHHPRALRPRQHHLCQWGKRVREPLQSSDAARLTKATCLHREPPWLHRGPNDYADHRGQQVQPSCPADSRMPVRRLMGCQLPWLGTGLVTSPLATLASAEGLSRKHRSRDSPSVSGHGPRTRVGWPRVAPAHDFAYVSREHRYQWGVIPATEMSTWRASCGHPRGGASSWTTEFSPYARLASSMGRRSTRDQYLY
jgi:AcrR family transcriptional regulator